MSTPEIFQAAADLFLKARDVPANDIDRFLDRECYGNDALRTEVRRLLVARRDHGPFETLAGRLGAFHGGLREQMAETRLGSSGAPTGLANTTEFEDYPEAQVGNYRLLERIGEGGFGQVWVAEQREPVQRRVAVKIIKAGMDSREVLTRFEIERQALAVMDHPNVAKVFDAGVTGRGRPYFVMEHVPGPSLTEFCDANRLRVRDRLALFSPVCDAVHHAHQKGIIHRDLKPSNILVTLVDGRPLPKVIDFGIAKATASSLTDRTVLTEMGRLMGTPEYMSPEQAGGGGAGVDTRSDVYSLGVVLYRLLTGTLPFDARMLRNAGSDGIVKIICELDPPRPSTRLSTLIAEPVCRANDAAPAEIGDQHGTDARTLQRELRGDLDWIVMKCMEKDRARRYSAASELAADVRRYLAGEPVTAAPPSRMYRLSKLLRRNRALFTTAGMLALSLLLGLGVSTFLFFRERTARQRAVAAESQQSVLREQADEARAAEERERRTAESERDQAWTEKAKAEQISAFLHDMLSAIQPERARGNRDVTVAEALDEASARVERGELSAQPEVEASVRMTIGVTYRKLGRYPESQAHLQAALESRLALFGEQNADVATSRMELGSTLHEMGAYADAEAQFRQAMEIQGRLFDPESPQIATAEYLVGKTCFSRGMFNDAQTHFESSLRIFRKTLGNENLDISRPLGDLGMVFFQRGDYASAEPLWREALDIRVKLGGVDDSDVANVYNNLATVLSGRGDYPGAIEMHRNALAIREKVLGPAHAEVAHSLRNLAICVSAMGDMIEGESLYRRALAIQRHVLPADHPQIAATLEALGTVLRTNGNLKEAAALQMESLEMRRRTLGERHPSFAQALHFLGLIQLEQGDTDAAEANLLDAIKIRRAALGRDDVGVVEALVALGRTYRAKGDLEQAEATLREAIKIGAEVIGKEHPRIAIALNQLGNVLVAKGNNEVAEESYREALRIFRARNFGEHRDAAISLHQLGVLARQRGDLDEAESFLAEALRIREAALPAGDPLIAETARELDALQVEKADSAQLNSPDNP